MGRYLKNVLPKTASYSWRLPQGTSSLAPDSPESGQLRYSLTSNSPEYYSNGQWNSFARQGTVDIQIDDYVGNGSTTEFTMSVAHAAGNEHEVLIFVGGVYQNPLTAYTVNGTSLSFTSAPPATQAVIVLHNFNSTNGSNDPL